MLLVPAVVEAHIPHDTVRSAAAPSALDDSAPWLVLSDAHTPTLLRSDDGGLTFDVFIAPPMGDEPVAVGLLDDGTYLVLGATGLWRSTDLDAWDRVALPGEVDLLLVDGDDWWVGGEAGVWSGAAGGTWTLEWEASVRAFGDGPVAIGAGGEVLVRDASGWQGLAGLTGARRAVTDGEEIFAGTDEGVWRWSEQGWSECAAMPGRSHREVVAMTLDGGVLYVATGDVAPFASVDRCRTWKDISAPTSVEYSGAGAAESVDEAVTVLLAATPRLAWGGWDGLWQSDSSGDAWWSPTLLPADYARAVAFDGAEGVIVASYAAGPLRSDDGGASWELALGLVDPNVQRLAVDPNEPGLVYGVIGHAGYRSEDGGRSWEQVDDSRSVGTFSPDPTRAGEVWIGMGAQPVRRSTDGGHTWQDVAGIEASGFTGHARLEGGAICAGTAPTARMWCAASEEGPWTVAWESGEEYLVGPFAWPPDAPTRWIFATEHVLHTSDATFTDVRATELDTDGVRAMTLADDGTTFAATRAGRILRSADGGGTWTDIGVRPSGPTWSMAARPGFRASGELLLGTLDGTWIVRDANGEAPRAQRFAQLQRLDDSSSYWTSEGCAGAETWSEAGFGTMTELTAGCSLVASMRGSSVTVAATGGGAGSASLVVDGDEVGRFGTENLVGVQPVLSVSVPYGWHEVEVHGVHGEGVYLDYVDVAGESGLLSGPDGDDESGREDEGISAAGCACDGSGGRWGMQAVLLAILTLVARAHSVRAPR